jgi:predicted nucleotidyltransferase
MRSGRGQGSDLEKLTDAVSGIEGVLGVVLFGSRARGDYDASSDYDLLVIFEDERSMWRNRPKLFAAVSKLGLFTQVLTRTVKELAQKTEPTFLQSIREQGKILYAKYPLDLPAANVETMPGVIISFSLQKLNQKAKLAIEYRLMGRRRHDGLLQKLNAIRIGRGAVLVPRDGYAQLIGFLSEKGIPYYTLDVYVPKREAIFMPSDDLQKTQ